MDSSLQSLNNSLNSSPENTINSHSKKKISKNISDRNKKLQKYHYNHLQKQQQQLQQRNDDEQQKKTIEMKDESWTLVYIGNENQYTCMNVVSIDAVENEKNLVVAVAFMLQTQGAEYPDFEYSRFSDMSIFYNNPSSAVVAPASLFSSKLHDNSANVLNNSTLSTKNNVLVNLSESENNDDDNNIKNYDDNGDENKKLTLAATTTSNSMSKTKKEIVSALVNGQQMIQIEKRNNTYVSFGIGVDYL
jgi:hypothetical protein